MNRYLSIVTRICINNLIAEPNEDFGIKNSILLIKTQTN
ncbi:hypothetical protein SAMN06265375_101303 [Muriicola jejuensis]|nr:hypothetical protein SAMN06265375_101303 [Muriicola jejuensis]